MKPRYLKNSYTSSRLPVGPELNLDEPLIHPRLLRITTVPISLKILLNGQLSFFQSLGYEVLAVSADGPEVAALTAAGINHQVVPMTRMITPFRDVVALFRLMAVIRKFRPDIVHTHTPKAGLLGMLAAWLCRVPVRLHTVAGMPLMETKGLKRSLLVMTEKITYACATRVYPNSVNLMKFIRDHIRPRTPVSVIGKGSSNGIDTGWFRRTPELERAAAEIRARYGVVPGEIVFSFVGRVVKDKGIRELIAAFRTLGAVNGRLLIVGPFEPELDPLPAEDLAFLHADKRVILAGFQQDVRPWIMASDVFVFPSYREGFPNVVMQACCLEVACIVSDINGCNEIILDDETGIIVPAKDAASLGVAMQRLSSVPALRKTFGSKARAYVVANFDQEFVWHAIKAEYEESLTAKMR